MCLDQVVTVAQRVTRISKHTSLDHSPHVGLIRCRTVLHDPG